MFPLRDENPTELTPLFTIGLIVVNVGAWVYLQGAGLSFSLLNESVCRYGMIPAEVTGQTGAFGGIELAAGVVCRFGGLEWEAVLTSMFLHGSWLHLIGNMWFLWLFGNNVEDSMGHLRYGLFYLVVGLAAAAAHIWAAADSPVPTVGASGAISGIMGAYLLLYPRIRIHTLFFFFPFVRIIPIPAWLVLGLWIVIQVLSGATMPTAGGGIAFWAHVGGFVAGVALVKIFENERLVRAKRRKVRLSPWELEHRGWW
ncbi:MAG: rhomboid family intramembrane serine protease [Gemmatimonadetes bacterium]|nr:rhomboid family intramembrane serine protease [Gemmatimonadota bacterium]